MPLRSAGARCAATNRSDAVPFFQMYERMWMLDFARATSSANASNTRSVYEGRSVSGVERDTQTLGERLIESFAPGQVPRRGADTKCLRRRDRKKRSRGSTRRRSSTEASIE